MPSKQPFSSTVRRPTGITVPRIDYRAYDHDPVGAGLNALVQSLNSLHGAMKGRDYEEKRAREAQAFKEADIFFTATEARREETSVQKLYTPLAEIFGPQMFAQMPWIKARLQAINGRNAGRKFSAEIDDGIANEQFATVADLDEFYNDRTTQEDLSHPGSRGAHVAGWFETSQETLLRGRTTVLQQDSARKLSQQRGAHSVELQTAFLDGLISNSPTAAGDFQETLAATLTEMRAEMPGDAMQTDEVVVKTFEIVAGDPDNYPFLDEFYNAMKEEGVLVDTDLRSAAVRIMEAAGTAHDTALTDLTQQQRAAVEPLWGSFMLAVQTDDRDEIEKLGDEIVKVGGAGGLKLIEHVTSSAASFERNLTAAAPTIDPEFRASVYRAMADPPDYEYLNDLLKSPDTSYMLANAKDGPPLARYIQQIVTSGTSGKLAGISSDFARMKAELSEHGVGEKAQSAARAALITELDGAEEPYNEAQRQAAVRRHTDNAITLDDFDARKAHVISTNTASSYEESTILLEISDAALQNAVAQRETLDVEYLDAKTLHNMTLSAAQRAGVVGGIEEQRATRAALEEARTDQASVKKEREEALEKEAEAKIQQIRAARINREWLRKRARPEVPVDEQAIEDLQQNILSGVVVDLLTE